ncbi:hypothetical protein C8R46DRAFT_1000031 [Mycena filopes]|nr:hypothetical protein C8R46DRAFT_1000031 [Mycena filopes]
MLQFHQFSACISIDGRQTPEYAVEVSENERTVTCWIASELGSRFSVEWRNASYSYPTRGKVIIDGKSCGARVLRARTLPEFTSKSGVSDAHCVKPFVFSALELTGMSRLLSVFFLAQAAFL